MNEIKRYPEQKQQLNLTGMNIRLKKEEKRKVKGVGDLYTILQRILMRESKTDRNREHFWTVSLDSANRILNIEMISMGAVNHVIVEPMEVFSIPLQKRSVKIVLVHNHPSGELEPSEADEDVTDRLIQVGRIMKVPVADHLIISETSFYSFALSGLLEKLQKSLKYVPAYEIKEQYEIMAEKAGMRKGEKRKALEMARIMKKEGYKVEEIIKLTGLSNAVVQRLKVK